jgi:tRNA (mo5U34)-methyltransferase
MSEARNPEYLADAHRQVERLKALGWYHSIELPDGSVIEGHQSIAQLRRRLAMFPVPEDLRGKRVLDIGAWDGWFSFEMERRGASVLALDSTKNTRLLEARKVLGSKIDYHIGDICRLTWRDLGTFDIVLFLGVLYHVKHPILALENVCGMTRDMACIESFVTDPDPSLIPQMEYYETTELRGQLDNWVGPNAACLLAFCRTAGFARVDYAGALGERAHAVGYRHWLPEQRNLPAPTLLCIENAASRDHSFSSSADDYITFYFESQQTGLTCDNVYPQIGGFGSRPIHVAQTGGGWQATCRIPPGLKPGWHPASILPGEAVEIGLDTNGEWKADIDSSLRLTRIADGKSFTDGRAQVGPGAAVSVWVTGLPPSAARTDVHLRLNGSGLPALWLAPPNGDAPRQINGLLPSGLEPGPAQISVVYHGRESAQSTLELIAQA